MNDLLNSVFVAHKRTLMLRAAARWELARQNPMKFLQWFVYTMDQHPPEGVDNVRPFPWDRPYMPPLVEVWLDNPRIVLCKSRQMMLTWWGCSLAVWDAMFHPGRTIILQSKTYDQDAVGNRVAGQGLLGRSMFILDNIPLKKALCPTWSDKNDTIEFPHGSIIIPIAQGGEKIQSQTVSGLFSDEAARQAEFGDALAAAMATLRDDRRGPRRGGSWVLALSTADMLDGGAFKRLFKDERET